MHCSRNIIVASRRHCGWIPPRSGYLCKTCPSSRKHRNSLTVPERALVLLPPLTSGQVFLGTLTDMRLPSEQSRSTAAKALGCQGWLIELRWLVHAHNKYLCINTGRQLDSPLSTAAGVSTAPAYSHFTAIGRHNAGPADTAGDRVYPRKDLANCEADHAWRTSIVSGEQTMASCAQTAGPDWVRRHWRRLLEWQTRGGTRSLEQESSFSSLASTADAVEDVLLLPLEDTLVELIDLYRDRGTPPGRMCKCSAGKGVIQGRPTVGYTVPPSGTSIRSVALRRHGVRGRRV